MNSNEKCGFIIESNYKVRDVVIITTGRGFCTVRFCDTYGAITIWISRVYYRREDAEKEISLQKERMKKISSPKKTKKRRPPRPPKYVWF